MQKNICFVLFKILSYFRNEFKPGLNIQLYEVAKRVDTNIYSLCYFL